MVIRPQLQLRIKQTTQLAPQVRQAIGLMTLTRQQLIQCIKETADTNPLLDVDFEPAVHDTGSEGVEISLWATSTPSLQQHLRWQVDLLGLSALDHAIAIELINHIDDRGLLRADIEEATEALQAETPELMLTREDITRVLSLIQSLDPVGIAALSVQHSLQLQLNALHHKHPARTLAITLLESHFESLGREDPRRLAMTLGVSIERLQAAYTLIQSLDPYPAHQFGQPEGTHIIPDVYIYPVKSETEVTGWRVVNNGFFMPRLSLNDTYQQLIHQAKGSDRNYLRSKYNEAKSLVDAVKMRQETLIKVTQALANYQTPFLLDGAPALKPLTQAELARELDLHVSTISRATRGKYAQTPRGLIELRNFFSRSLQHKLKGTVATEEVKARIVSLIETEDLALPLSDQAIAAQLEHKGVKIARRTVTKYREQMGIGDSKQRRHQAAWRNSSACQ